MSENVNLELQQDRLWSSHYWLTREVIRDAASKSPCLDADVAALMNNQKELGSNFAALTNNSKAGRELAKELTTHIEIAIEIVKMAIAGKNTDDLYKKWQANATQIAKIYNKYNRKIRLSKIDHMMQKHLSTTLAEAVAIIKGKCKDSQKLGYAALEHIQDMSDYINSKF